jgi:hypothetical protein
MLLGGRKKKSMSLFKIKCDFCKNNNFKYVVVTEEQLTILSLVDIKNLNNVIWNKGAEEYINEKLC